AVYVLGKLPPRRRGQVHRKSNPAPGVWRQRAVELAVSAEAVRVRRRGAVANIKLGIVAVMVERISLEQGPPLAAAGGGEPHVHEQRILVDEVAAAIRCGAVVHEEPLLD